MPGTGDPLQRMLRRLAAEIRAAEPEGDTRAEAGAMARRVFLGRAAAVGAGIAITGSATGAAAASPGSGRGDEAVARGGKVLES